MKVIGYIRVSTKEQAREGLSLEVQHKTIVDYCALRDLVLVRIIEEAGVSAAKPLAKRPGGALLTAALNAGEAQGVVAVKLDRLFRDVHDCLGNVKSWDSRDMALHLVDQGGSSIDTRSAMGRFFITILGAVAEMERNLISDRVRAVINHKQTKRERTGTVPYGYRPFLNGAQMEPDPHEQQVIAYIKRLRQQEHLSYAKVTAALNDQGIPARGKRWYKTSVTRLLQREADPSWRPDLAIEDQAQTLPKMAFHPVQQVDQ